MEWSLGWLSGEREGWRSRGRGSDYDGHQKSRAGTELGRQVFGQWGWSLETHPNFTLETHLP
jgi:hypothetical protein